MDRRRCVFVLLIVPFFASADRGNVSWRGPNRSVYVVTQNHYAEGFTPEGDTARFGDLIAIEIFEPSLPASGKHDAYKIGERLALFAGGQRVGDVTIKKVMPLQCDSSAALVSADPSIGKDTMVLATNATTVRPHPNRQREPTAEEQSYAKQLAMKAFETHGVSVALAKNISLNQLVVTKLSERETKFVIGSLFVEEKGVRHEVFLIGRLDRSGAAIELARYHKTTDLEDGTDSEDVRFVDQLDIDGDKTDQIVVEVRGYESEEFKIYKRQDGVWRQVYIGYVSLSPDKTKILFESNRFDPPFELSGFRVVAGNRSTSPCQIRYKPIAGFDGDVQASGGLKLGFSKAELLALLGSPGKRSGNRLTFEWWKRPMTKAEIDHETEAFKEPVTSPYWDVHDVINIALSDSKVVDFEVQRTVTY